MFCPASSKQPTWSSIGMTMRRLDPAQTRAAMGSASVQLTLAGPGSGKTSTLTGRFIHLIRQGVDPNRILAVTFTKKAADEMRHRIARLLELPSPAGLNVMTFHAFAFRLLKRNPADGQVCRSAFNSGMRPSNGACSPRGRCGGTRSPTFWRSSAGPKSACSTPSVSRHRRSRRRGDGRGREVFPRLRAGAARSRRHRFRRHGAAGGQGDGRQRRLSALDHRRLRSPARR